MTLNKACFLPFSRSPVCFSVFFISSNHTFMLFLWIWAYDLRHRANKFLKREKTPPQARRAVPGRTGPAITIIRSRSSFQGTYSLHNLPYADDSRICVSTSPLSFSSVQLSPYLTLGFLQARPKVHYETRLSCGVSYFSERSNTALLWAACGQSHHPVSPA